MHKRHALAVFALGTALLVPVAVAAATPDGAGPPSVTVSVAAFVKKLTINVTLTTSPGGTTIVGYYLSESPSAPGLNAPGWKQAKPSTFTLSSEEGSKHIYGWVKGANGSLSARSTDTTLLDMTAPTVDMDSPTSSPTRTIAVDVWGDDTIGGEGSPAGINAWAVVAGTTAPGVNNTAWKTAAPTSFKLSAGNGDKTVSAFSRDRSGNVSDPHTHIITLAVPAPTVGITMPAYTNKLLTSLSLTRTDAGNTGIAGFCVSMNGTTPAANSTCWKPQPTNITLTSGEGVKTVYAWVKDNNGTISARNQTTTLLDQTAPTVDLDAPAATTTRTVSGLVVTGDDDASGVVRYAVVAGTTAPGPADNAWKTVPVTTFSLSLGNGNKTLSAFSRDAAGNVSAASTRVVQMNLPAPTVTVSMASPTNKVPTPLTINTTDPGGTGVAAFWVSNSSTAPTAGASSWGNKPTTFSLLPGQGSRTVYVWVKDNNGSVSAGASATTVIDTTVPTVTLDPLGSGGTTTTKVINVDIGGSDTGTGITGWAVVAGTATPNPADAAWKSVKPTTFTLSTGNGFKTVSAFSRDAAGNVSPAATRTVTLAIPAPTVGITMPANTNTLTTSLSLTRTVDPSLGVVGFYVSESSATPALNSAGWKPQPTSIVLAAGDGIHTVYAWVKDSNNSISAVASTTTRLDTVVPQVTTFTAPTSDPDGLISITLAGSDVGGSGVAKYALVVGSSPAAPGPADPAWKSPPTQTSFDLGSTPGDKSLTVYFRDNAGNVSGGVTHTVTVGP